jgi:hypothetical protein
MRRHVASAAMAALLTSVLFWPFLPFVPPPWKWPTVLSGANGECLRPGWDQLPLAGAIPDRSTFA